MTIKTIPDLFRRCRGRETGHWRVGGDLGRTVHLDSGDIVFASSNIPSDKLSAVMVECGKLTQGQMDNALANLKPGMTIGKNLIEMGLITQKDLLDVARLQVERIVCSALSAPEPPAFDIRDELEQSVVRLPLDTPTMLFKGVMGAADREGLLEMLGPLNQVLLLQGKRVYELELPADLLKMAPLMDGTHTILEMSSEAGVEPMRTAAFALFLREIGWGKLFELPPIDRQAVTKALDTPDPTRPPSSIPLPRSQLMGVIEEAGKITVKLNDADLDAMLDDLGDIGDLGKPPAPLRGEKGDRGGMGDSGELKEPPGGLPEKPPPAPAKPVGRMLSFEPAEPRPPEQDGPQEGRGPSIKISREDDLDDEYHEPLELPMEKKGKKAKGSIGRATKKALRAIAMAAIAVLLVALAFSLWKFKTRRANPPFTLPLTDMEWLDGEMQPAEAAREFIEEPAGPGAGEGNAPQPPPSAAPSSPPPSAPLPPPPASQPPPPAAPPTQAAKPPAPQPGRLDVSREARFRAIADGNASLALEQGMAFRESLPKTTWTIQLIVACQSDTLQNCAQILGPTRPEFFVTPVRLPDGRSCYRLFVGRHSKKDTAEAEVRKLLNIFPDRGVQPRAIQVGEIREVQ